MTIETMIQNQAFPGVQALKNVDLEVFKGEIHGLVGKNGAGKSTLVRVLMGLQELDGGFIQIENQHFTRINSNEALRAGVAYVPQQVNMMDCLSVAENVLVGDLPKNSLGLIDWKNTYREAADRLEKLGLHLDVYKPVEGLSIAEQTMLAIAKALFGNARLIILDESTAPLPRADINQLFEFVRSLKEKGVSFIYISHHLEEVFEICDRVTVLRDGQTIGTFYVADLDMSKLTKLIVGEDVREFERKSSQVTGSRVLEINGLTRRGYYENINLTIDKGEVVGISGLQGCGAEALAAGLFGLERLGIGKVSISGKVYNARDPKEAFVEGLALLPQNRYRYGLVGMRAVRENITYTIIDSLLSKLGIIRMGEEKKVASEYINGLGIKTPSQEQMVKLLSGGNQQKVVFAKLAASKPSVLILHEPTTGIDVRAKQDIFRIIDQLASEGQAILIISSEVRELIGVCDRILVMYRGLITQEFKKGDPNTTPHNILQAIEGGNGHAHR
jgi:ribose transport system ATP-binding protein